ncbi:MAG: nicotinic acid mononucleotide adenylyltransferase, partial [Sphingomonadaceae bacterium]|nr:nicotinic acid mononucleotide adenylyltransferase [Sphingomonadaceae bacterium]
ASFASKGGWSAPKLVILRFDPDSRSATALRRADPDWATQMAASSRRDMVTHHPIPSEGGSQAQ